MQVGYVRNIRETASIKTLNVIVTDQISLEFVQKRKGFGSARRLGRKEALEKLHAGGLQIVNALQTSRALTS